MKEIYFLSETHILDPRFCRVPHIVLTMRSLLEVMLFLSGGVSTPDGCAHGLRTALCEPDPDDEGHAARLEPTALEWTNEDDCDPDRDQRRRREKKDMRGLPHGLHPFFRVHCSPKQPRRAAVSVSHDGYWFYIREDDLSSRRAFMMLLLLFQQQIGKSVRSFGPTLTLPVGR